MSRRQKGRKHREVNRTPRPVGRPPLRLPGTSPRTHRTAAPPAARTAEPLRAPDEIWRRYEPPRRGAEQETARVADTPRPSAAPEPSPAGLAPASATSVPQARQMQPPAPLFALPVRSGGLGLPAARTWQALRESGPAGASVADLSTRAGFTTPTVVRHLRALAGAGLARAAGDAWHPTEADPAHLPAPARS